VADYSKIQNYAAKDSGALDANRLITGTGIDNELNAISAAIATKANTSSPTLVTPNIGVATGTSLALTNGQTIGTSLTVGTTLGVTGVITATGGVVGNLTGTASLATTATTATTAGIASNSKSTNYTCVIEDGNGFILHPISDNNARTFTIPANSSVPYPIGTALIFVNEINTVTISITSDTLMNLGDGSTGSRTLAVYGMATALKITNTKWVISGKGLT